MKGILGKKLGMTQIFDERGIAIPVTLINVPKNIVTSVMTTKKDGYDSIQLGIDEIKKSRQKKGEIGHFKKANTAPLKFVKEIRNMSGYKVGDILPITIFETGEFVDVIGTSKGKGFAGAIKRHNQKIGPRSHGGGGGSKPVRQTGSLGDISGNKVVKGMTMPGRMGFGRSTIQNLEVVAVDTENELIVVKGSIPGPKKSYVIVQNAIKGIPNTEPVKLLDLKEHKMKIKLIDEANHYVVEVNMDMSVNEIKAIIDTAKAEKEKEEQAIALKAKIKKDKEDQANAEKAKLEKDKVDQENAEKAKIEKDKVDQAKAEDKEGKS